MPRAVKLGFCSSDYLASLSSPVFSQHLLRPVAWKGIAVPELGARCPRRAQHSRHGQLPTPERVSCSYPCGMTHGLFCKYIVGLPLSLMNVPHPCDQRIASPCVVVVVVGFVLFSFLFVFLFFFWFCHEAVADDSSLWGCFFSLY